MAPPTCAKAFRNGLWDEIPVFRLILGICPTLAVTTVALNGITMGAAATFVLVGSALFISLLRSLIPDRVRIPIFIIVVATFVTTADYLLAAFVPDVHAVLGIFVPLIVVNCIVFGRVEAFSYRNPVPQAVADALGSGIGFTLAITLLGGIRELLGAGTLFGRPVLVGAIEPMLVMKLPTGAFVTLGLLIAAMNVYDSRRKRPSAAAECASCAKCGVGA